MERIVQQGLLYDFYGELLTDRQRRVYEDVVFGDLSASEIAREQGISRQGVHELIRRCDQILGAYEEQLGLVEKFLKIKEMAGQISALADAFEQSGDRAILSEIRTLAAGISGIL